MDSALLLTVGVVLVGLNLAGRWLPPMLVDRAELTELWVSPVLFGFLAARIVFVAFDNRSSLWRVKDLLVFRSGLEFWAGAAVAVAGVAWTSRSRHDGLLPVLAASAPFALIGNGLYESACVIRDGCFGPVSRVGLIPGGLTQRQFPVGLAVGATLIATGYMLHRWWSLEPRFVVLLSMLALAGVRAVASRNLPAIGPSRVGFESMVVAAASALALIAAFVAWIVAQRSADALRTASTTDADLDGNGSRS